MITKGQVVRQVLPAPIEGVADGFVADDQTGEVTVRVVWTDAAGVTHSRYFKLSEVEAV